MVLGTLLGPETTGPPLWGWFCFFWFPAHGLSRSQVHRLVSRGGGGCDGVVVWELHSGREHLVKQDRPAALSGGWLVCLFCKAISYDNESWCTCPRVCVSLVLSIVMF